MAYEVLARKWRPQLFEDVVGQEHVTRTLQNALQSGRVAHAYLFVGPRGIGKTSVARIFAKALNCVDGPTVKPCGKCDACREIAAGNCMDVIEIDAASNTGVDHVRDLRETVKYSPVRGKYKVYIIDEVHMLSTAAFNALLKTLEEPPPHVVFMFATTEPEKVLATIVSRCQRFNLRRIPVNLIIERLHKIAAAENLQLDDDAALAIARGAEGGMRDAQSALDQMISFTGAHITEPDVLSVFGLVSRSVIAGLVDAVLNGDAAGVLQTIAELDTGGKDLQRFSLELLQYFRDLLVVLNAGDAAAGLDVLDSQLDELRRQAGSTSAARVLRVVGLLAEAEERMRYALSRRTVLEVALLRATRAATVVSLEDLLAKISALAEGGLPVSAGGASAAIPAAARPEQVKRGAPPRELPQIDNFASVPERVQDPPAAVASAADELAKVAAAWAEIVKRVGDRNLEARPALADTVPVELAKNTLTVGVYEEFAEELKQLESPRVARAITKAVSDCVGRQLNVSFALMAENDLKKKFPAQIKRPADNENGLSHSELFEHEAVKSALKVFGGSISEIKSARPGG